jgi:hypothetical protein
MAQVSSGTPNIVRQAPGQSGGYLGQLPANEIIYVLDGPRCTADMAWWYVADTQSRLIGWTSEGQGTDYWLAPVYPPDYVTATPSPTAAIGTVPTLIPFATNTPDAAVNVPIRPSPTATVFVPTATPPTFYPTTTAIVCNATLPPRLVVGRSGRVTPGIPNNIRAGAGTSTAYVGEIPPGGVFTVLEGPQCASGMAWWKVNYNGLTGWTPEGQAGEYWVEPA